MRQEDGRCGSEGYDHVLLFVFIFVVIAAAAAAAAVLRFRIRTVNIISCIDRITRSGGRQAGR